MVTDWPTESIFQMIDNWPLETALPYEIVIKWTNRATGHCIINLTKEKPANISKCGCYTAFSSTVLDAIKEEIEAFNVDFEILHWETKVSSGKSTTTMMARVLF